MQKYDDNFIIQQATEGADRGVNLKDETLGAALGDPFVYDPIGNPEHGEVADDCGVQPHIAEQRAIAEKHRTQAAKILGAPFYVLLFVLLLLILIEFFGGMRVMTNFGFLPPENWLFGIALTFVLCVLVMHTRSKTRKLSFAAIGLLTGTSVAVGAMRMSEAGAVEGIQFDWAGALVTVITVMGPAFLAEKVLSVLVEAYPLLREAWNAEKKAKSFTQQWRRGMSRRHAIAKKEFADTELRRRIGSLFDLHYNRRRAEIDSQDPNRRHITRTSPSALEVRS